MASSKSTKIGGMVGAKQIDHSKLSALNNLFNKIATSAENQLQHSSRSKSDSDNESNETDKAL